MNRPEYRNLLTLLRNAVYGESKPLPVAPDWQVLVRLARIHGVEPLLYDAALRLPESQAPDKALATQMKQVCLYQMQQQTLWIPRIHAAVEALRQKGIEPVLLKGFGLAELYPKPYLRSWGDADIWVGVEAYHPACGALREAFPEAIHHDEEYEELKHYGIVFPDGNAIELHRVAMDFPTRDEEAYWQTIEVPAMRAAVTNPSFQLSTFHFPLSTPSEPFNLLFVFLHMWEHFCGTGMPLKQVLDLALLVKRDYWPLSDAERQQYDNYLLEHLRYFHLTEAWQLVAYLTELVTGVRLPLSELPCPRRLLHRREVFVLRVMEEGLGRQKEFSLGGTDRYDERERVKQLPVWRRKLLTLRTRIGHARFLRQFTPEYARHTLKANILRGIRRTIHNERMIDY